MTAPVVGQKVRVVVEGTVTAANGTYYYVSPDPESDPYGEFAFAADQSFEDLS